MNAKKIIESEKLRCDVDLGRDIVSREVTNSADNRINDPLRPILMDPNSIKARQNDSAPAPNVTNIKVLNALVSRINT